MPKDEDIPEGNLELGLQEAMDLEDSWPLVRTQVYRSYYFKDKATASHPSLATLQKLYRMVSLVSAGDPEAKALTTDPDIVQWAVRMREAGHIPKDDLNEWDPYKLNRRLKQWLQAAEGGAFTYQELTADGYELPKQIAHGERLYVYWREKNTQPMYPKWQFIPHLKKVDPDVRQILRHLDAYDDCWRVMAFFLLPKKSLDNQSPLELIRRGFGDMVADYAERHSQSNDW
jgi:hypothetical protein